MPNILNILPVEEGFSKEASAKELASLLNRGMDWGTLLVYTCENDCGGSDDSDHAVIFEEVVVPEFGC
jgi:hypothetical protein